MKIIRLPFGCALFLLRTGKVHDGDYVIELRLRNWVFDLSFGEQQLNTGKYRYMRKISFRTWRKVK